MIYRQVSSGLIGLVTALIIFNYTKRESDTVTLNISARLSNLSRALEFIPSAYANLDIAKDRVIYVKSLYYFVNGGADGTWPKGEESAVTGHNAPSTDLKDGFLGIMNGLTGPDGDISKFLQSKGFTKCSDLPSADTEYSVTDAKQGALTLTIGSSTKAIPSGLKNTGKFEKRILIKKSADVLGAVHLHCSTTTVTELVRVTTPTLESSRLDEVEAIMESVHGAPYTHLQFTSESPTSTKERWLVRFFTEDGSKYQIHVAQASGKTDSSGNGPAHTLAAASGTVGSNNAALNYMLGNTSATAISASSDASGTSFDASKSFVDFPAANKFCLDLTTGATATGCTDVASPGSIVVSGMTDWTMTSLAAYRSGTVSLPLRSTY